MPSQSASAASSERLNRTSDQHSVSPAPGAPRVSPRSLYRVVATAEMITWALLIAAMIGKYALGAPDWTMRIAGSIHGFVFLSYSVSTVVVWTDQRWPASKGVLGLLLAVVPFATVPFERHVDRKGLLASQWRVAPAGIEPQNGQEPARTAAERLLAVILRWPILSAVVLVVFVAALFTILLNAGPPTEWFN